MLESECREAGVQILTSINVGTVEHKGAFTIRSEQDAGEFPANDEFRAPTRVVATGGLSIPKMGATSFGYKLAQQFGGRINDTLPALVTLLFQAQHRHHSCDLTGGSAEVVESNRKQR